MGEKRFVVSRGAFLERYVEDGPSFPCGGFLTREQAARQIISEMNGVIEAAKISRIRAKRILHAELRKRRDA